MVSFLAAQLTQDSPQGNLVCPELFQLGEKDIEAYSQGLAQGELFEGLKLFSGPSVGEENLDAVKVEELPDTVAGPDDILLYGDECAGYLAVFSPFFVRNVACILEVVVL
jgi:hypothetical protein